MGYDLTPKNDIGSFHFGAFSFPVLLDACGYLFACIHDGPRWFCNFPADPRMIGKHPDGSGQTYPAIMGGGFQVTAEEAVIMARMARNFVDVQRILPEENRTKGLQGQKEFKRDDVMKMLMDAMNPTTKTGPWPAKIRDDFTETIEAFSEWAPKSGGFHIAFSLIVNGVNVAQEVAG